MGGDFCRVAADGESEGPLDGIAARTPDEQRRATSPNAKRYRLRRDKGFTCMGSCPVSSDDGYSLAADVFLLYRYSVEWENCTLHLDCAFLCEVKLNVNICKERVSSCKVPFVLHTYM